MLLRFSRICSMSQFRVEVGLGFGYHLPRLALASARHPAPRKPSTGKCEIKVAAAKIGMTINFTPRRPPISMLSVARPDDWQKSSLFRTVLHSTKTVSHTTLTSGGGGVNFTPICSATFISHLPESDLDAFLVFLWVKLVAHSGHVL